MTTWPEHFGPRKEKANLRPYRTFWLKVIAVDFALTIKGCMYYIDTGTVQMPYFGRGIALVVFDPVAFKIIEAQVRAAFFALGEPAPVISEERRKQLQRDARERIKAETAETKPVTQEQSNAEYFRKKEGKR